MRAFCKRLTCGRYRIIGGRQVISIGGPWFWLTGRRCGATSDRICDVGAFPFWFSVWRRHV